MMMLFLLPSGDACVCGGGGGGGGAIFMKANFFFFFFFFFLFAGEVAGNGRGGLSLKITLLILRKKANLKNYSFDFETEG